MKKLFLHIGYPKTGTTGLQRFLEDNSQALGERGTLYPKTGRLNCAHYMLNFSLGIGSYDGSQEIPDAATLKSDLLEEAHASRCDTVIISSEYFITSKRIFELKNFFSDFETRILVYLRRHDYAFESSFAQAEKTVANPPWEPDIASFTLHAICSGQVPFDYLGALRRWAEVFGHNRIIVRPFEKQQNTPDLFADFLAATGTEDSPDFVRPGRVNSSLSRESLLALRMVRKLDLPAAAKEKVVSCLLGGRSDGDGVPYFTPALRSVVVAKYAPSYRAIAREFMDRRNGVLFLEAPPRATDPVLPPSEVRPQDVVGKILSAVAPLLKQAERSGP